MGLDMNKIPSTKQIEKILKDMTDKDYQHPTEMYGYVRQEEYDKLKTKIAEANKILDDIPEMHEELIELEDGGYCHEKRYYTDQVTDLIKRLREVLK